MRKILLVAAMVLGLFSVSCAKGGINMIDRDIDLLTGKEFVLVSIYEDLKIDVGFDNGRFYGFSGVNRYMGRYIIKGNNIELSSMGSTMMAGPEEYMNAETDYLRKFTNTKTFTLEKGTLTLGDLVFKSK